MNQLEASELWKVVLQEIGSGGSVGSAPGQIQAGIEDKADEEQSQLSDSTSG